MSCSYRRVRLKMHRVYSVDDLMAKFGVVRNTVSNWVKSGLIPSDERQPYMFRGAVVNAFHDGRRKRSKIELRPGEFKCLGCKMAVFPEAETLSTKPSKSGAPLLSAVCSDCGASLYKLGKQADLDAMAIGSFPNANGDLAHEENGAVPADVGISELRYSNPNDRIIYAWQRYAERFDPKTADRHLTAIRRFEEFLDFKPFTKLTVHDCQNFRSHLKDALLPDAVSPKSKSSIQHTLSHSKDFLTWLGKQDGCKRLPTDLVDALEMPRAVYASAARQEPKPHPSIEEARGLLSTMPAQSLVDKRARVIFAIAFLGALRADTIVSLRLEDIDLADKIINQDGTRSRTKNGKSFPIKWFPIGALFEEIVKEWVEFMRNAGFENDDALFPDLKDFTPSGKRKPKVNRVVRAMRSKHAVSQAFRLACANHHMSYNPHSAKHAIKAEMDRRQLTREQRKAWSQNMGHDSEQTTELYYGKMDDQRRIELMESENESLEAPFRSRPLTVDDLPLIADAIVARLS